MKTKEISSILSSKDWKFRQIGDTENPLGDFEDWEKCDLPFQWQINGNFRYYTGKGLYAKTFSLKKNNKVRYQLWIRGIFYYYHIYLNSKPIEHSEGYFSTHLVDVTKDLVDGENDIRIVVSCPPETSKKNKKLITGVFSHWDCLDNTLNPAGIWGDVELRAVPLPITIEDFKIFLSDLKEKNIHISVKVMNLGARQDVDFALKLIPHNFKGTNLEFTFTGRLSRGMNEIEKDILAKKIKLWWPYELGIPLLYDVFLSIKAKDGTSVQTSLKTGFRTVKVKNYVFYINGHRIFIRGSNIPPIEPFLSEVTYKKVKEILILARDAHMNMLRVHAHVDSPILYELADEMGILLWQDFPLQWLYDRSVLPRAKKQVIDMITLLFAHPSVVTWSMHNEPIYVIDTKTEDTFFNKIRLLFSSFIWSWNRDVMDKKLASIAEKADNTRFINPSSGTFDLFRKGTDGHLYFGWYPVFGKLGKLDMFMRIFPANIRFVTEFGAQSFPNYETSKKYLPDDSFEIDWQFVETHYLAQRDLLNRWVNINECEVLKDMIERTQSYQAELNRYYVDRLRAHKYRPCGGFLNFMLFDSHFAISWSVIDNELIPKSSYFALKNALNPVYAFTLVNPLKRYSRNFELFIYTVNDSSNAYPRVGIEVKVEDEKKRIVMKDVLYTALEPDSPVKCIGRYSLKFRQSGIHTISLRLKYANEVLDNCYTVKIR